jgi:hypothetical protein
MRRTNALSPSRETILTFSPFGSRANSALGSRLFIEAIPPAPVRVTGTLRFVHYPELPPQDPQQQRVDDHYYFDAETAKVELTKG